MNDCLKRFVLHAHCFLAAMFVGGLRSAKFGHQHGGQKTNAQEMMCFITHVHILFNMKLYIAFKSKTKLFALGVEKTFANNADVSNKKFFK